MARSLVVPICQPNRAVQLWYVETTRETGARLGYELVNVPDPPGQLSVIGEAWFPFAEGLEQLHPTWRSEARVRLLEMQGRGRMRVRVEIIRGWFERRWR